MATSAQGGVHGDRGQEWRGDPYSEPAPGWLEMCACTNIMRPICSFLPDRLSNLTAGPLKPISRSTAHSGPVKVVLSMGVTTGQEFLKLMIQKLHPITTAVSVVAALRWREDFMAGEGAVAKHRTKKESFLFLSISLEFFMTCPSKEEFRSFSPTDRWPRSW